VYEYIYRTQNMLSFTHIYRLVGPCLCTLQYIVQVEERYTWRGSRNKNGRYLHFSNVYLWRHSNVYSLS